MEQKTWSEYTKSNTPDTTSVQSIQLYQHIPNTPKININWSIGCLSERSNYISYPRPINPNRHEWHNIYLDNLLHMYDIVSNIIDDRYPNNKIIWEKNSDVFHNLSRLIYHCSSKHIDSYL